MQHLLIKAVVSIVLLAPLWASNCPTQNKFANELADAEQRWAHALDTHNTEAVACILADEFQDADTSGQLHTRQQTLARVPQRRPGQETLSELDPHVFGDYGYIGDQRLLGTYDWGIQVSIPIFDGLRREGRIEEAKAMANEIDVRRRDLRQKVAIEVRGALLDLASARQEADAVREALRLAQQEVAQAQERFRAGVAGNADVITASLALNSARTQAVDALASYQGAKVALARAVGSVTALP